MTDEERARQIDGLHLDWTLPKETRLRDIKRHLEDVRQEALAAERERFQPLVEAASTVLAFVEFEMKDNPRMRNEPPWRGPLDKLDIAIRALNNGDKTT